jgi:hypothetical protein
LRSITGGGLEERFSPLGNRSWALARSSVVRPRFTTCTWTSSFHHGSQAGVGLTAGEREAKIFAQLADPAGPLAELDVLELRKLLEEVVEGASADYKLYIIAKVLLVFDVQ